MRKKELKYLYGPVPSWRLGRSLGIDPLSQKEKVCTFDCIYCQLGRTGKFVDERKIYVKLDDLMRELETLPPVKIDYLTFSGRGEPTLAKNLGEMIRAVKGSRKERIAVITNSSLLYRDDTASDLMAADFILAKLDACSEESLRIMNSPARGLSFNRILKGIRRFRSEYRGRMALQIMFTDENKNYAEGISRLAHEIGPDEVQINTPLRKCRVRPLPAHELKTVQEYFRELDTVSVYESRKKKVEPISSGKTLKRRGKI